LQSGDIQSRPHEKDQSYDRSYLIALDIAVAVLATIGVRTLDAAAE
jgi:hypothetical protein